MKKTSNIIVATLVSGLLATSAAAENKLGLGVSMTGNSSGTIRGIVDLGSDMRLEPYVRLGYLDQDIGATTTSKTTNIALGSAFHMLSAVSSNIKIYYGGYVGLSYAKTKITGSASYSNANLNLGPVGGAEYLITPELSAGAEVSVNIIAGESIGLSTSSELILRYYF